MKHLSARAVLGMIVTALVAAACGDPAGLEPSPPTMADVAGVYTSDGEYSAIAFLTDDGDLIVDWLAEGARLELDLEADGTSSGELYIPVPDHIPAEEYFEPEDIERGYFAADMAGTWTLDGNTVELDQPADSFVRDTPFAYSDGTLSVDHLLGGEVRLRLVLSK